MNDKAIKSLLSWLIVSLGVVIAGICIFMQYRSHASPRVESLDRYSVISKKSVKYNIDSLILKNRDYTELSGWIFIKKSEPQKFVTSLVLYSSRDDKDLIFPLKMVKRVDVAKMRKKQGQYNYEHSGFEGYIPVKYMTEMPQKRYKIGFLIGDGQETKLVKTGIPYKIGGLNQ